MDRPARSALQSLNALLASWFLPQLQGWPKTPEGFDPYGYVVWRALRKRGLLVDDGAQLALMTPFRCTEVDLRYWDRGGDLHVMTHPESVRQFITAFHAGAYPALRDQTSLAA
jgi:hypothetical protein